MPQVGFFLFLCRPLVTTLLSVSSEQDMESTTPAHTRNLAFFHSPARPSPPIPPFTPLSAFFHPFVLPSFPPLSPFFFLLFFAVFFLSPPPPPFADVATPEQKTTRTRTHTHSMFGIASTAVVAAFLFAKVIKSGLRRLCCGVYKPVGRHAKQVGFTEVEQINAYVPGVRYHRHLFQAIYVLFLSCSDRDVFGPVQKARYSIF